MTRKVIAYLQDFYVKFNKKLYKCCYKDVIVTVPLVVLAHM